MVQFVVEWVENIFSFVELTNEETKWIMDNMDNEELVSYYLKRSQDWIFIPQFRTVKIEDDEILDLDSMNLDSNEDTWYVDLTE